MVEANTLTNVNRGVYVYALSPASFNALTIAGNTIDLNSAAGTVGGIDASTQVQSGATATTLTIANNTIFSSFGGTISPANSFYGIKIDYWTVANVIGNTIKDIGGPAVWFGGNLVSGVSQYNVVTNVIQDAGRVTGGGGLATGILYGGTSTAATINAQANSLSNSSTAYMATGISGGMNASGGFISGNAINNIATAVSYSGTVSELGVSCSATPSASFATKLGVTTHC